MSLPGPGPSSETATPQSPRDQNAPPGGRAERVPEGPPPACPPSPAPCSSAALSPPVPAPPGVLEFPGAPHPTAWGRGSQRLPPLSRGPRAPLRGASRTSPASARRPAPPLRAPLQAVTEDRTGGEAAFTAFVNERGDQNCRPCKRFC